MKRVVEYTNYRQYILDYYLEKKASSGFTWRAFAKLAGFASGSYLKLVCDGKTRLTNEGATKTAMAMGLVGFELSYFLLMVHYNDVKDNAQKKVAFEKMIALASTHNLRVAGGDFFRYYDSWRNPVLRELVPAMPGAKPSEIAGQCYPAVSAKEVQETIDFLVEKGILVRDNEGCYHQTDRSITTGRMETIPEAVHFMQEQMSEFAMTALNELPTSERNFSGVTIGITKKAYEKIVDEMAEFRRRVIAIATEDDETDQVYRMNLQFFPLTKTLNKNAVGKVENCPTQENDEKE